MKYQLSTCVLLFATLSASAQVASHAPVAGAPAAPSQVTAAFQVTDKPVAKVNGKVLTDRDLLREMYAIFPYGQQHGGFPKGQEAEIRRGAMDMIIFEELVYQEALRRKLAIPQQQVTHGEREFRKQFQSEDQFQSYLKTESHGSMQVLYDRVRRALLIEAVMRSDVDAKAKMSPEQVRAYYEKNHAQFSRGESYTIQTISILPPRNATPAQLNETRKRAEEAYKAAKTAKTYQEFGLLAEKMSDDDFRVNMGDHKTVESTKLPPEVVAALKNLKAGQVSNLLQLGPNFTIVRVNAHVPAGTVKFEEVKAKIREDQQKARYNQLRSELAKKLKKNAKVEIL